MKISDLRDDDIVTLKVTGALSKDYLGRGFVRVAGDEEGDWSSVLIPRSGDFKLKLVEAKGHPKHFETVREGDTARLPEGTIVRARAGASVAELGSDGFWWTTGREDPLEGNFVERYWNAEIIYIPSESA